MNVLRIYIIFTFICALFFLQKKNNAQIFLILFLSATNEILLFFFPKLAITTNFYVCFLFLLWIDLLLKFFKKKSRYINVVFIIATLISFSFFGFTTLNYYNFVIGTLIYCLLFLIINYKKLKQDDFSYFRSNEFILLSSPILFFLGVSLILSFGTVTIAKVEIYNDINLYTLINYTSNMIYYSLINLYIYKEYKKNHVQL